MPLYSFTYSVMSEVLLSLLLSPRGLPKFSGNPTLFHMWVTRRRPKRKLKMPGLMHVHNWYAVINRALTCGSDHPSSHRLPPPSGMFNRNRTTTTTNVAAAKSKRMFDAREMKRKKRVAKYKWYAVEGKVKASLKKGYRWFKRRCSEIVRGF